MSNYQPFYSKCLVRNLRQGDTFKLGNGNVRKVTSVERSFPGFGLSLVVVNTTARLSYKYGYRATVKVQY